MIINVILPFWLAWADHQPDRTLAEALLLLYTRHPPLAVNSILLHMCRQLGLAPASVNRAVGQQGLLHIYKTRCIEGQCAHCPLS
jgi:hypothetical protein